ncbi:MAG: extracellular solute-binding protein [Eubacteriales bacterium]|nr:extracellular solute-binding protein [Eubacteriales bacterium]
MTRKILCLALALCMALGLLAGCSGSGSTTTTASTTAAGSDGTTTAAVTAPTTAAATGNPVFNETGYPIMSEMIEITGFFSDSPELFGEDIDETAIWKKLREATNIHINWNIVENDATVINLYFAAGELDDFFACSLTPDKVQTYGVEGGAFVDISESLYTYMPNMVSRFEEWPMMEKMIREIDGSVYTIPQVRLGSTAAAGQLYYRTDLLDSIGVEEPTTTTEFYDALTACKDADVTGGYAPLLPYSAGQLNSNVEWFLFAALGESTDPDFADDGSGKVVYNKMSDQYYRYLEYVSRLYEEGLLEKEIYSLDTATVLARYKSSQAVFMTSPSNIQPEDCLPNDGKVYLDMMYPLTSDYNSERHVTSYRYLSNNAGGISVKAEYPEAIMRMLDIAYADTEVIPGSGLIDLAWNSGFEGEQYTVDPVTNTYAFIVPEDWDQSTWTYVRQTGGWNIKFGVYDFPYLNSAPNNYAREVAMTTKNIPFAVDYFPETLLKYTADEQTEKTNKLTDITNYVDQMRAKFITGVEPLDHWDSYLAEIERMGVGDVLEIMQTAYDRWNEA